MANKIVGQIKLQIQAGAANPSPPVGPALGQKGVNIMEFCNAFNNATKDKTGMLLPVIITVYDNRSFTFVTKSPPAAVLIKKELNIERGSSVPNRDKVGVLTMDQLRSIARVKMEDLNASDVDHAAKIIAGTCRSMGVDIKG